jgi:hypothetical protein
MLMTDKSELTSERLLHSSLRTWYDPAVEIDWDAPCDPDTFWMPPRRSSLYGTALWDGLDHRQRVELTKQEVVSAASAGIWFETVVMQILLREYHHSDPTTKHAQYALTEIADECRHSVMFGRLIDKLGCRPYPIPRTNRALGHWLAHGVRGPHQWAAILIGEEVLDAFQREIMVDTALQPLIRAVTHIHVVEEARHVGYAHGELPRRLDTASPPMKAYARLATGRVAYTISRVLINPRVYAAVGIRPRDGWAAARSNPHWRDTLRWAGRKAYSYLSEMDLVAGPGRLLWRKGGLV